MPWPCPWPCPTMPPGAAGAGPPPSAPAKCTNLQIRAFGKTKILSFTLPKGKVTTSYEPGFLLQPSCADGETRGTHRRRGGGTGVVPPWASSALAGPGATLPVGPATLGATSSCLSQLQGTPHHPSATPRLDLWSYSLQPSKTPPAADVVYIAIKSPPPSDEW